MNEIADTGTDRTSTIRITMVKSAGRVLEACKSTDRIERYRAIQLLPLLDERGILHNSQRQEATDLLLHIVGECAQGQAALRRGRVLIDPCPEWPMWENDGDWQAMHDLHVQALTTLLLICGLVDSVDDRVMRKVVESDTEVIQRALPLVRQNALAMPPRIIFLAMRDQEFHDRADQHSRKQKKKLMRLLGRLISRIEENTEERQEKCLFLFDELCFVDGPAGEEEVIGHVVAKLNDQNAFVRRVALETLAKIVQRGHECKWAVVAKLDDPDWEIREMALSTLQRMGDNDCSAPVAVKLEDPNANVKYAALKALSVISSRGDRDIIAAVAKRLMDNDAKVKLLAFYTLAVILAKYYFFLWPKCFTSLP
jgi:hypothetical protein